MKYNIVTRRQSFTKWLRLEGCDECTTINSDTYIQLFTDNGNKSIVLCDECFKKATSYCNQVNGLL